MASKTSLILLLLLAGCGAAAPDAADNGQASSAQANAAEATTSVASAPAAPTPAEQGPAPLTPEGWGPLRIGMTLAEITAALGPDADPGAVGGPDPASCDQFRPVRAPQGMLLMVEEGRLTRISLIDGATVRSDRGIGLGDGRAKVEQAYGKAAVASLHKYVGPPAGYLDAWVGGGGGDTFAPPPTARGIRYEIDDRNVVSAIHAGGPSIHYVEGCS